MPKKSDEYFKILITGDDNYNNLMKFNITMQNIYSKLQDVPRAVGTFGRIYGAELLGRIWAEQHNDKYVPFTIEQTPLKNSPELPARKYHILLNIAVKWSDLVLIFSNIETKKIKQIIQLCQRHQVPYLIINE